MKRVVFVTAPVTFRDEEYYKPKQILTDNGIEVITASTIVGKLIGKLGYTTNSSITIDDVNVKDFDALVFIGGNGASVYFNHPTALKLANDFYNAKKIIGAICIAPTILANSKILNGKNATVFIDGKDALIKNGANYTGRPVEIDENIITANGPDAAVDFGKALLEKLK